MTKNYVYPYTVAAPTHRHVWIGVGDVQKCEHCSAQRTNPALLRAEQQESRQLNRSSDDGMCPVRV